MEYIQVSKAFRDQGESFYFPEDLLNFLETGVALYVSLESDFKSSLGEVRFIQIGHEMIEKTITTHCQDNLYVRPWDLRDGFYPWEWSEVKINEERLWFKKEDLPLLFNKSSAVKSKEKDGSRSDVHKIEILSAAIQLLVKKISEVAPDSKLLKKNGTLNVTSLAEEGLFLHRKVTAFAFRRWDCLLT